MLTVKEPNMLENICINYVRYCNDDFEDYSRTLTSVEDAKKSEIYQDIKEQLTGKKPGTIGFMVSTCDDWDLIDCEAYIDVASEELHIVLTSPWDVYDYKRPYKIEELIEDFREPYLVSWEYWYDSAMDYYWELIDNNIITEEQLEEYYNQRWGVEK